MAKEVMTDEEFVKSIKKDIKDVYGKNYSKWLYGYFSDYDDKEKAFTEVIMQYCPDTQEHKEDKKYVKKMLDWCYSDFISGMAI